MDTDTYNCINIDTYTDIFPILVTGRVLTLNHLAAKERLEDGRWFVVIIATLCVIVRAITGTVPPAATEPPPRVSVSHSDVAIPPAACVPSSTKSTSPGHLHD